jgi:two-component system sensor histidine kinase/response regulator
LLRDETCRVCPFTQDLRLFYASSPHREGEQAILIIDLSLAQTLERLRGRSIVWQDKEGEMSSAIGKRILLVDDEPQLCYSVREFLSRVGYEVVAAESGPQALDLLVEDPPDLIISDILMDGMDGFEFQRRVQSLTGAGIPFIFLTAKGDLADRLEGLRAGADDYIVKPFEPEELEARIAAVLNRVEHTRKAEQREIDALRSRILAEVAQQLRTPVTSIMAHLNLLLAERFGQDQAQQERYLQNAIKDANALRELIQDLSWAAKEEGEELSLKREPTRVAPVVRGAAANAARLARERGIEIKISCGGLLSANIDGNALSRALAGLLDAAVMVSPQGSRVEISAVRAAEGGLEFVIADGGCERQGEGSWQPQALDYARRVVRGHGGQLSWAYEQGRNKLVIWLPGRVAKHVGKRA